MEHGLTEHRFVWEAYSYCVTVRCDGECPWCEDCQRETGDDGWDREPPGSPGTDARVIRLHGGDVLRHGDLSRWMQFARGNPRAWVEIEGPADALGGPSRERSIERLLAAAPDGIAAVLPTAVANRTRELTGRSFDPELVFESLRFLSTRLAVHAVFPVHRASVTELARLVRSCHAAFGADFDLVLRKTTDRRGALHLPLLGDASDPLSAALSRELSALPAAPRQRVRLHFDRSASYPPCVLEPDARHGDLCRTRSAGVRRDGFPLGAVCSPCSLRERCDYQHPSAAPAPRGVRPLSDAEVLDIQAVTVDARSAHVPHAPAIRRARAELGLPDVLCVAPWTSMSPTQPDVHPVPCAISWVKNAVAFDEMGEVLGISASEAEAMEESARRQDLKHYYSVDNENLSLDDLWNNPLLRLMRRQMLDGGPSRHCRSVCRVLLGVEDRGIELFQRPDSTLSRAPRDNRALLREEMHARAAVLRAKPLELVMGVAANCNITCGFCVGPQGAYGELSDRRRGEIEAWLPTLLSFTVSGPGEPLMSKNYRVLLEHIADRRLDSLSVGLTTNGTLLTPEFLARHSGIRWSHVRVSLNAGSARTHERMTGKKMFDRVVRNLDALCALRDRGDPRFSITLSCVLSELAMGDLHAFATIVNERKTNVVVEPMYGDLGELSPWTRPERLRVLADELGDVARAFTVENPPLARAFQAVEDFARKRLDGDDFSELPHR